MADGLDISNVRPIPLIIHRSAKEGSLQPPKLGGAGKYAENVIESSKARRG